MKKFLIAVGLLLWSLPAQAQQPPLYCNAAAVYDTSVIGSIKIVNAPNIGGIYVCGFSVGSVATATISVKFTYSTSGVLYTNTTGFNPLVTGALQTPITPAWTFVSPTVGQFLVDHPGTYNGLFVPPGNQLNVTTSLATGPIQSILYYWTQNP